MSSFFNTDWRPLTTALSVDAVASAIGRDLDDRTRSWVTARGIANHIADEEVARATSGITCSTRRAKKWLAGAVMLTSVPHRVVEALRDDGYDVRNAKDGVRAYPNPERLRPKRVGPGAL